MNTNDVGMAMTAPRAASATDLQEAKALAYAKKGILLALASGMIFSLDGLLVKRSDAYSPFSNAAYWFLVPLICAGTHDFCAAVCTTFANWRQGRFKEVGRSLLSRPGRAVIIGALFGAVFGMGGYMAGLKLAGPAYVLPITSLYPAVAAVLAIFILKERISPRAWMGLLLCVGGAVAIGYTKPDSQPGDLFYWGLLFAAMAAVGWGTEGVCATFGMDFIEPAVALNIYYAVSSTLFLCVFIPGALLLTPEPGGTAALGEFLTSPGLGYVALAGCVGACSYRCWYKAMAMTGVSRGMAMNISYALWGILFSAFTGIEITRNLVIGALIIFAGMFLVIGNPKDMLNLRNTN